jgi:hypothetical protein
VPLKPSPQRELFAALLVPSRKRQRGRPSAVSRKLAKLALEAEGPLPVGRGAYLERWREALQTAYSDYPGDSYRARVESWAAGEIARFPKGRRL